jgi:hypothetical protein
MILKTKPWIGINKKTIVSVKYINILYSPPFAIVNTLLTQSKSRCSKIPPKKKGIYHKRPEKLKSFMEGKRYFNVHRTIINNPIFSLLTDNRRILIKPNTTINTMYNVKTYHKCPIVLYSAPGMINILKKLGTEKTLSA